MRPLVSIIVPIYKIDRYLGLCIESVINQTYSDLEIILVDDGSPDRCPEICDLYAKKDCRIKVIHKKNGGLVSARKAGLIESNGEFISYVDGDDWIDSTFIESLYSTVLSNEADIVCAGFTRDLFSKSVTLTNGIPFGVYKGCEIARLWRNMISEGSFYHPGVTSYVWNKMFRREILLDPQMKVDVRISIGEDAAVTYPALLKSRCVVVMDNCDYHYRQREDSMLKQCTGYAKEAEKLLYLYDYLISWAKSTDSQFNIVSQVEDYILANEIMRSGGRLAHDDYSTFDPVYYGKRVVIYNAGTFGQQLMNRFKETNHCEVVAWIDDDYWEYRRCCLDVDPVESISSLSFDYVLVAKVDEAISEEVYERLIGLGVEKERILTVSVPDEKKQLIKRFLDVDAIKAEEAERMRKVVSHA